MFYLLKGDYRGLGCRVRIESNDVAGSRVFRCSLQGFEAFGLTCLEIRQNAVVENVPMTSVCL